MPTSVGPNTFGEENLVFGYDLGDVVNSYKGEPTTNFAYLHNGRKDSSYESYMPESATGQIAALHPGAIRVYNQNGSDISYYLNTGINISNSGVNWYDTNHAYWVYDDVLKKPVVQMIDRNGVWQAKYMGLGANWTDLGLTNGDQYTISWLQWSSDGVKRAHAGIYWYDTTAGYSNFWDGLSDTGTSTPGKWTRVSQTFTLSAGRSLNQGLTWYMYGMYYSRAILRIADVQIEKKSHATPFTFSNTRSATQGLMDLTGNSTINLSTVSFDSNAQVIFDGTDDSITCGTPAYSNRRDFTFVAWVKSDGVLSAARRGLFNASNMSTGYISFFGYTGGAGTLLFETRDSTNSTYLGIGSQAFNIYSGEWVMVGFQIKQGALALFYHNSTTFYYNETADSRTGNFSFQNFGAGSDSSAFRWDGYIDGVRFYDRVLTQDELKANFKALKTRFI